MRKALARRGLDRETARQLTRCENLLIITGVASAAAALAVAGAWLLGVMLNGAIGV